MSYARRSGARRSGAIQAPLLLVIAVLTLATGLRCGGPGGGDGILLASTGALWADPDRYDGRRVRTTGTLLAFNEGESDEHYVIEGPGQRRVEVRDVDHARLAAMTGRRVEVIGRFHFDEETGFGIEAEAVQIVG